VILRLAVSVEHHLVADRHTMMAYTALAWGRKTSATYPQSFCSGTGGGKTKAELAKPGSPRKWPLKWR